LDAASGPQDIDLPGDWLHELKGQRTGTWSVKVSGNWRMTFRFGGSCATDVDFEDYH
jgi:proteic killer suppression protein